MSSATNAISHTASSVHSSITNTSTSTGKEKCPDVFKVSMIFLIVLKQI